MSKRIDFTELRASLEYMVARPWEFGVDGLHGARTYLALVEAVEAVYDLDGFPGHTWRCEYRTAVRGWKPGEPPIIDCQCGLERLEAALARFDFGDGRAV